MTTIFKIIICIKINQTVFVLIVWSIFVIFLWGGYKHVSASGDDSDSFYWTGLLWVSQMNELNQFILLSQSHVHLL